MLPDKLGLQSAWKLNYHVPTRASGEIGIHARLKILWALAREGSSPSSPTNLSIKPYFKSHRAIATPIVSKNMSDKELRNDSKPKVILK